MTQFAELESTTDERRGYRAGEGGHVRTQAEHPPGGEGLALALRLDGRSRSDDDGVPDEVTGRLADEHLVLLGGLLEPRGDVDRIACRELLVGEALPEITSPVLTPIRVAMRTPYSRSRSALTRSRPSRISSAARTARSASSSWTAGTPNTATIASPMNFSTVPPCRSSVACIVSK